MTYLGVHLLCCEAADVSDGTGCALFELHSMESFVQVKGVVPARRLHFFGHVALLYFNNSLAPASTLWWKGFTVARYVVESEMMAALYTMIYAFNDDTISDFNDDAIWIVDGYEDEPKAAGLILNEKAGTPSFPVNPYIALLLVSIGSEISDFIINDTKSKKALKKMEKAYIVLAKNLEYM